MIDPFGDETPSLVDGGFGVVDAVERGTGLESGHIVGSDLAQFAIGGHHCTFAPAGYETFLRHYWTRSLLRIVRTAAEHSWT